MVVTLRLVGTHHAHVNNGDVLHAEAQSSVYEQRDQSGRSLSQFL